ncbi:palmitoyltransferase ZDHHC21-like [Rhopilema esculentum]|uniref:palmitoyltransferase ZDHHC21-like n=1 Tax=Rhopilema esculentum TaxID=499914 RepID=UPI0031DBDD46
MVVRVCERRVRGDWVGIFTCTFIFSCWAFAAYCSNFTIIQEFFRRYKDERTYLHIGHASISVLTILTMLQCVMSNAGHLHDIRNAELLGWHFCDRCQKFRPPRSHHCRRCGHCIRKMDHHCPWINNCVGEDNVANFIQFLFYAALMSWSTLLMCLAYFLDWLPECAVCNSDSNERFSIHVEIICLTIISVAFAAFTSFMFVDRMLLVAADVTTLELMNDRQAIKKSFLNDRKPTFYKLLSRSFGTSNVVDWFMPYAKRQIRPSYEYNAYNWLEHV